MNHINLILLSLIKHLVFSDKLVLHSLIYIPERAVEGNDLFLFMCFVTYHKRVTLFVKKTLNHMCFLHIL